MEEDPERQRALKARIMHALTPEGCVTQRAQTREQVFGLILDGQADLLLTDYEYRVTEHYAVRFHDPELAREARAHCIDTYGLDRIAKADHHS